MHKKHISGELYAKHQKKKKKKLRVARVLIKRAFPSGNANAQKKKKKKKRYFALPKNYNHFTLSL